MGICKSVVIATVVAIRDVVTNGFHCNDLSKFEWVKHPVSFFKKNLGYYGSTFVNNCLDISTSENIGIKKTWDIGPILDVL